MRWQLVFAGFVTCIQALAPAPIVWGRLPAQRFVLAPKIFPNIGAVSPGSAASPQELKIWDQQGFGMISPDEILSFMPQPDKTIASVTMGSKVCLEASGSSVRVNRCIGGPTQAWTILPWMHGKSQIQLQDTNNCILVEEGGDQNGAPVKLRECENKMTELWTLGEPFSLPTQIPSQRSVPPPSARLAFMSFISMSAFGILSLTAWLWLGPEKLRVLLVSRGCIPLDMEQGSIRLAVPLATFQGGAPCNTSNSMLMPAVMAFSPEDTTGDADNATVERVKEAARQPFQVAVPEAALIARELSAEVPEESSDIGSWIDLCVPASELRCENTLEIGQTFGWKKIGDHRWIGVVSSHAVILESLPQTTRVMLLNDSKSFAEDVVSISQTEALNCVRHYLRLDELCTGATIGDSCSSNGRSGLYRGGGVNQTGGLEDQHCPVGNLQDLYERWSRDCDYFAKVAAVIPGVRILRQDVFETFISFVISQNNNVARITQILQRIRERYGRKIHFDTRYLMEGVVDPSAADILDVEGVHTFPTISEFLAHNPSEQELRDLGMGYRAKYIRKIIDQLKGIYANGDSTSISLSPSSTDENKLLGPSETQPVPASVASPEKSMRTVKRKGLPPSIPLEHLVLQSTRGDQGTTDSLHLTNEAAIAELMCYHGVGRKVADCIALFACNRLDLVPVDTHVYQLAGKLNMISSEERATKSLKSTDYDLINRKFRERFGTYAGWAHSVLFAGELPRYRKLLEQKYGDKWDEDVSVAIIFQLGTNNWQRPKKDGSGELEFAPGSGVLHEAHHIAYNNLENVKCYSMYPSKNQGQPAPPADYAVLELEHDIPICESASPNSSKRWHSMPEDEFSQYCKVMEDKVFEYTKVCEEKEGKNFTMFIAHHSFVNPLVLRKVIKRRMEELGKPRIPLYCFVHGTALKMYRWELGGKEPEQFPMRFHKMICDEKLFDDIENGINACFVISEEQKGGIAEIFPTFPQDRVIVAPNGINVEKFKPREKDLTTVITEQTRAIVWPAAAPSEEDCNKYTQLLVFVGKYAEWKRQAALLHAAATYEKDFPGLATFCAGTGPEEEKEKLVSLCDSLGLKNTFLLGARGQDLLAEMYTVANLGCFPSYKEPFGLVFVECMACKTPVIGANSGGPKDFVTPDVGELVAEPPETTDLSTVPNGVPTLAVTLTEAISRALKEDWKASKGDACIKLAHDKFTVQTQVTNMLSAVAALPK